MQRWIRYTILAAVLAALVIFRPDRALQVASGMAAHTVCSAAFVSKLDPQEAFVETVQPMASVAGPFLRYSIDQDASTVETSIAGIFSAKAAYHPGYGCRQEYADSIALPTPSTQSEPLAEDPVFETANAELRAALDHIFTELKDEIPRHIKAVVIVKDGRIVAEKYAAGIGPETPLPSFSIAKSVTNALVGILVRQGKLNVNAPAVDAWRNANDPRATITLDNLIRMASGLAFEENGSGFDPVSRMLYLENDMAAYAQTGTLATPPGSTFDYTSANTLIVAGIVKRAIGGGQAGYVRFAQDELFVPAGMRRVTLEFDGAGTQVASTAILAPARDWARFGQLFLNGGIAADGKRILPEGWVAYSKTSTADSSYGAGFWTNDSEDEFAERRIKAGMPHDTFFASGNRGQRIYIIPSERMVVVRLGMTHRPPDFDIAADLRLLREAIAALKGGTPAVSAPLR
ncbi:MAG: serine hydrolase [Alphaproteobacteria bacterium]|nr:serine hydrolase [Alphaproteobacteria bacterium]